MLRAERLPGLPAPLRRPLRRSRSLIRNFSSSYPHGCPTPTVELRCFLMAKRPSRRTRSSQNSDNEMCLKPLETWTNRQPRKSATDARSLLASPESTIQIPWNQDVEAKVGVRIWRTRPGKITRVGGRTIPRQAQFKGSGQCPSTAAARPEASSSWSCLGSQPLIVSSRSSALIMDVTTVGENSPSKIGIMDTGTERSWAVIKSPTHPAAHFPNPQDN